MKDKVIWGLLVVVLLLFVLTAFSLRYTITGAPTQDTFGAYKLDRWTGRVWLLANQIEMPVEEKSKEKNPVPSFEQLLEEQEKKTMRR